MRSCVKFLIIWVIAGFIFGFIFDWAVVMFHALTSGKTLPEFTPADHQAMGLIALQALPFCLGLAFILAPIILIVGDALGGGGAIDI
ncbi:MAG: hypothetical protein ACFFCO_10770 [Promethearchaeota archaeon]